MLKSTRHVLGTGFWNGASTLKQHFVLPKNGSKYYLKYTFLVFPVLGIFGLGTSLVERLAGEIPDCRYPISKPSQPFSLLAPLVLD